MPATFFRVPIMALMLLPLVLAAGGGAPAAAGSAPVSGTDAARVAADDSQLHLTIAEPALLQWLRVATPFSLTVGRQPLRVDLIFSEPSALQLQDGRATMKIRVRSSSLPIDQTLSPIITIIYDQGLNKYFGVLSSLPVQIPGLGSIDLKDSVSRFEIPPVLENLWRFPDRPIGLGLNIRRLAIRDHRLEVGADVIFSPLAAGNPPGTR
jgi:hypothetical protein